METDRHGTYDFLAYSTYSLTLLDFKAKIMLNFKLRYTVSFWNMKHYQIKCRFSSAVIAYWHNWFFSVSLQAQVIWGKDYWWGGWFVLLLLTEGCPVSWQTGLEVGTSFWPWSELGDYLKRRSSSPWADSSGDPGVTSTPGQPVTFHAVPWTWF